MNGIGKMVKLEFIDPAQTERALSIAFAPEQNSTLRFWVDYRKINAVAVLDSYYTLRMG